MFVDDEFYALLAQFRDGVRIHAVFDSCHSATAAKALLGATSLPKEILIKQEHEAYHAKTLTGIKAISTTVEVVVASDGAADQEPVSGQPIKVANLSKALDGERPELAEPPKPKVEIEKDLAELFADLHTAKAAGKSKSIQLFSPIYEKNKSLYDAIKNVVGPQENQQLSCSVVTLSACQDAQTTPAGEVLSLFTYNLTTAWGSGGFSGSYRQFHRCLADIAPSDSTPAINPYGTNAAQARFYERPLVF
jgi:metacaspase-1